MAVNSNKTHTLPTAGFLKKAPPEMHGTTGEANNTPDSKNIELQENYVSVDDGTDRKPPEEVQESLSHKDHSSEEEGIFHNTKEEFKGLEHDWTPENIPDPNFEFEEDAEDVDGALGLDFKEEGVDGDDHVEWSGDSLGMLNFYDVKLSLIFFLLPPQLLRLKADYLVYILRKSWKTFAFNAPIVK